MRRRVTMADISKAAGVSVSTVSRALNGSDSIPERTRQRIIKIAEAHNYVIDARARNFRLQRSQTIATVFPFLGESQRMISDPFYMEMLGAITDALNDYNYDVIVSRVHADDDGWCQRYVLNQRVDGFIIIDRSVNDVSIETLHRLGAQFVAWGPPIPGQDIVTVGGDSAAGARRAVAHMADLGRRCIGFIGGHRDMVETHERYTGYRQGLADAGLPYRDTLVAFTDFTPKRGTETARRMMEQVPALDGLFVCSDFMAMTIMEFLRANGRRVPDDISVVGYDDIQLAAYCSPRLSTVRQPIYEGGQLMVRKLFELMEDQRTESTVMPIDLIVRDSCGGAHSTAG